MGMIRLMLLSLVPALFGAEPVTIGLSVAGHPIQAIEVTAKGPTVVAIGGLDGTPAPLPAASGIRLMAISLANPDKAKLIFPPSGTAYRDNPESNYLWRWIGTTAPDLVVILGKDDFGLAKALSENSVAGIGKIPVHRALPKKGESIAASAAHQEMERRLARSPRQLADQLAQVYGHEFPEAVYIPAMALIGRLRLGERAEVEKIAAPLIDSAKDSLAKPTASHLAGHLLFGALAERTSDHHDIEMVRHAADLAANGTALYNEMSDGVFMGCPILAKAGKLTGDPKYFGLAERHLEYMQKICLRADGLYRHSPLNEAAWGRGNAFPALGLALALSDVPRSHPAFQPMLSAFRAHMKALARFQTEEGMWREVVDLPGAYSEFSATAMIGTAMRRGISNGWLDAADYQPRLDSAWQAILRRTASDGRLIDVCEGTGKQKSVEDYLHRAAILDRDPRGGGMALFFATEMAGLD